MLLFLGLTATLPTAVYAGNETSEASNLGTEFYQSGEHGSGEEGESGEYGSGERGEKGESGEYQ